MFSAKIKMLVLTAVTTGLVVVISGCSACDLLSGSPGGKSTSAASHGRTDKLMLPYKPGMGAGISEEGQTVKDKTGKDKGKSGEGDTITGSETETGTGGAQNIDPVDITAQAAVSASSALPPANDLTYFPENTVDKNPATSWNEGVSGTGIGEWLMYTFSGPRKLSRVGIIPGYAKDDKRWYGNHRIKLATISASDGSQVQVSFADSPQVQYVDLNGPSANYIEVSWLKIQIDDIYPGTKWDDTCVSEVEIWGQ